MAERCEKTELLKNECDHCKNGTVPTRKIGHKVHAEWAGKCKSCGEPFDAYDLIAYSEGQGWIGIACCG